MLTMNAIILDISSITDDVIYKTNEEISLILNIYVDEDIVVVDGKYNAVNTLGY